MAATLSEVRSQSMSILNFSTTYGTKDSDLGNTSEIDESAIERDLQICQALIESEHPHAAAITASTASSVATGTTLVDHLGPIFDIKRTRTDASVVQAELVPYDKLLRWQRNDSSLFATANLKERYVSIFGGALYFAGGGSASYKYRTLSKTAALQAPADYTGLIVAGVLGDIFSKEGLSEPMATFYGGQFVKGIEGIWAKRSPLPLEMAA